MRFPEALPARKMAPRSPKRLAFIAVLSLVFMASCARLWSSALGSAPARQARGATNKQFMPAFSRFSRRIEPAREKFGKGFIRENALALSRRVEPIVVFAGEKAAATTAFCSADSNIVYTIAGDIGGTNSRFALYEADLSCDGIGKLLYFDKYKNEEYGSFDEVLSKFVSDAIAQPEAKIVSAADVKSAAFAIAGPVYNGSVRFTNLKEWGEISAAELTKTFGFQVDIINDFVGLSQGLVTLQDSDLVTLHKGEPTSTGTKFCIGAGTGLGEGYLTYNNELGEYEAFASEGGHADFVPRTMEHLEMAHWIRGQIYPDTIGKEDLSARISVERICSGGGLINTYEFLRQRYPDEVNAEYDVEYEAASFKEKPAVISRRGMKDIESLMGRTIKTFLFVLGTEVANAALKFLPYGGVYIAGGIVPKLLSQADDGLDYCDIENPTSCQGIFMSGLDIYSILKKDANNKGRMGELLDRIPVYIVVGKVDMIAISGSQIVAKRSANRLAMKEQENINV